MRSKIPRYAARVDANQSQIVDGLRAVGVWVEIIGRPVDLLWVYHGTVGLMEIKLPGKRLTEGQRDLADALRWQGYELPVVRSLDEALKIIGVVGG